MPTARRFLQLDVFAEKPGDGNALGVVLESDGLDGASMQSLAAWLNLSETVFFLPPAPGADYRVRIFTPRQELPFAGHPSVGSAFAALQAGLVPADAQALVQDCAAGLLPVGVSGERGAWRTSVRAPRAKLIETRERLPVALPYGDQHLPPALLDNGPRWWCVALSDEAAVRSLQPDLAAIAVFTQATGAVGLAVFALTGREDEALVVRAFCPADQIPEDPVTGSANACIAAYLRSRGRAPGQRFVSSQGREMGRDGRIGIAIDAEDEVWIGGASQVVVDGQLQW